MRPMEHPIASQSSAPDRSEISQHRTRTDADTYERDPQIRSMILPDLVSADALIPAWLRKRFRRTDTPAAR
jgi:hypothetical protein